jgi:Bromodomain extra-terminal - transcription regulation
MSHKDSHIHPSTDISSMTSTYTSKEKRRLVDRINHLGTTEHNEILNIIKRKNIGYTQNNNGTFVHIAKLDEDTLHEIDKFVSFCHDNKKMLDEYDQRIQECKLSHKYAGICEVKAPKPPPSVPIDENWFELLRECKEYTKIKSFMDRIVEIDRKKASTGANYTMAKKRYGRRAISEKQLDLNDVLQPETPDIV